MEQLKSIHQYESVRLDENTWLCKMKERSMKKNSNQHISIFNRVRKVTRMSDDTLKCSCCLTERFRIPC